MMKAAACSRAGQLDSQLLQFDGTKDNQYIPAAMARICVYSGSSFGASPEYATAAAVLATACARRGLGIVYGGSSAGLMGVLADAALAAGGEVIGVIPRTMIAEERAHDRLTQLIPVESMHERKVRNLPIEERKAQLRVLTTSARKPPLRSARFEADSLLETSSSQKRRSVTCCRSGDRRCARRSA
jgi:hypothetical protein